MGRKRGDGPGQPRGVALMLGIFAGEVGVALLLALARRPGLALICLGATIALAVVGLRRTRQAVRAAGDRDLAAAWTGAARAASEGSTGTAIAILETARARTGLDASAARLLIDLHASADDLGRAVEVALEHLSLLDPGDVRNMIASLESWGERRYAAVLEAAVGYQRIATRNSRGNRKSRLPSMRAG